MKDQNVYYKDDNGNYIPFGLRYDENYLPDGIWYVRHHEGCKSISNVNYLSGLLKLADPEEFNNALEIGLLTDEIDYILRSKEMGELLGRSYTINELVSLCVGLLYKKNNKI